MKRLVIDSSAALGLFLPDESDSVASKKVRAALDAGAALHVPAHWWVEFTNGVLMAERRKRLTQAVAMEIIDLIAGLEVVTDDQTETRIVSGAASLARQHGLTAYDAGYLELAIRTGATLVSQDKELLRAAKACGVDTLS